MTSRPSKQTIAIHILSNEVSEVNEAMKSMKQSDNKVWSVNRI